MGFDAAVRDREQRYARCDDAFGQPREFDIGSVTVQRKFNGNVVTNLQELIISATFGQRARCGGGRMHGFRTRTWWTGLDIMSTQRDVALTCQSMQRRTDTGA